MSDAAAKPAFMPPRLPVFDWGMRITAAEDLFNDGSHPHAPEGALLAPKGTPGEIVRVGHAGEPPVPVYLVEFPGGVLVGCLEEELAATHATLRPAPGVIG